MWTFTELQDAEFQRSERELQITSETQDDPRL